MPPSAGHLSPQLTEADPRLMDAALTQAEKSFSEQALSQEYRDGNDTGVVLAPPALTVTGRHLQSCHTAPRGDRFDDIHWQRAG